MRILAIESSCDETGAAIVEKKNSTINVLSNITASSLSLHATTGGIIPENAARLQVKYILPVITAAIINSQEEKKSSNFSNLLTPQNIDRAHEILKGTIDAIAVTTGPGLIGSLLVGVESAKTISMTFNKPIIPINHLLAHIHANFINRNFEEIKYPFIGLIVSGGHTDLLCFEKPGKYKWLGGTRDDAAGEAFDKIGRLLNLNYPAGPEIEQRALLVSNPSIVFKSPLLTSNDFDFSFSGLKTEVARFVSAKKHIDTNLKNQVCYAAQKAIIDVLIRKTLQAATISNAKMVLVGGGVSANELLRKTLSTNSTIPVLFPEKIYSTDNAAMIGAMALIDQKMQHWSSITANPEEYFIR